MKKSLISFYLISYPLACGRIRLSLSSDSVDIALQSPLLFFLVNEKKSEKSKWGF